MAFFINFSVQNYFFSMKMLGTRRRKKTAEFLQKFLKFRTESVSRTLLMLLIENEIPENVDKYPVKLKTKEVFQAIETLRKFAEFIYG